MHHPTLPAGAGATTVADCGGSVPVAAPTAHHVAPTAASPPATRTATTGNIPTNDQAASLTNVPAGATINLDGPDFGAQPGRASIVSGNKIHPTDVVRGAEKSVNLTLPQLELTAPAQAKFVAHRANGSTAREIPFQMSNFAR